MHPPESLGPTLPEFVAAWDLFRDPVICGVVGGAVLGYLGVHVVLRRLVFVSAAVTQGAGLGVALCFYAEIHLATHIDPLLGAAALALATTAALVVDPRRLGLTRESVLGFAFAITGGGAVIVGARIAQEAHDIQAILFGTAVLVRTSDLLAVEIVAGVILAIHLWWHRGLSFATIDPVAARVQGLPVPVLDAIVLLSIGAASGVCARALGALPVFAFSTLPAVAALAAGLPMRVAHLAAAFGGALAGGLGYVLAFLWDLPVGAAQTVCAAALVVVVLGVRSVASIIRRVRGRGLRPAGAANHAAPDTAAPQASGES